MPAKKLRVLFVEANPDDIRQTVALLEHNGFLPEYLRVEHADAMRAALLRETWDVILCSYNPPAFGGLEALTLMQSLGIDLPFLFLAHNTREENIIQAIQAGAGDFIFKGNLSRLVPAIEHYQQQAGLRREHRQMLNDLKLNQARLHALISNIPGIAYQFLLSDSGEESFPYVSEGCHALLGISPVELQQNPALFSQALHKDDLAGYQQAMHASAQTLAPAYWEGRITQPDSEQLKWISLRCSPHRLPQGVQWEGVMFDITERKQAEIEILSSQEQLRELSAHIQDVREQERLALAREVHDDMGSMLTAIKLDISWLANRFSNDDPATNEKIADIENLVSRCAAAAGNIARNLRPSALDSFGIIAAIEIEAAEFAQRTGISCKVEALDEGTLVDPNIAITLFRIFQEAINNVAKHAHASKVQVKICNYKNKIDLQVSDNGKGLSEKDKLKPRSFGLRGISERVERFRGDVYITSNTKLGTTIAVSIPHIAAESNLEQAHQQTLF